MSENSSIEKEPTSPVGSESFPVKKSSNFFRLAWLVGLPLFFGLVVIFSTLLAPVQTRQLKEFEPLSGAGPAKISYKLALEHLRPQKLILKLAATAPVSVTLSQAGQNRYTTQLTPPPTDMGLVEISLATLLADSSRIEPVTLELNFGSGAWKLAYHNENVYREGAFLPGADAPTTGDLVFIVDYGTRPLLRLDRFFTAQQRWNGPAALVIIPLLAAFGLVGLALFKFSDDPTGLLNRILQQPRSYLIFGGFCMTLTFSLALSFALINPPLQGPDEQGHVVHSIGLGREVDPETLAEPTEKLMEAARLVDNFSWLSYDDKILNELPANNQAHQAPLYYGVAGLLVKISTLFTDSFAAQTYLVRLASILFWLGTLGAALATGWVLRSSSLWLALGLPLTVTLWPQGLFLASVSNNDNAAACFAAWASFGMLLLYRAKTRRDWLVGLGTILLALVLADFSKRTVASAWLGFALGFWVLILVKVPRLWKLIWLGLAGLGLISLAGLFLFFTTDTAARGWYSPSFDKSRHIDRTPSPDAASGKYVLKVDLDRPVEQVIDMFYRADVKRVYFTGKLRTASGAARLKVELIGVEQVLAETSLDLAGNNNQWQPLSFEAAIPSQVANSRTKSFLIVRLSATDNPVLVDELYLYANQPNGPNLMVNSSLEEGNLTLIEPYRSLNSCLVCYFIGVSLDIVSNRRDLILDQAVVQNLTFFFLTSWGAFGWGQIFLNFLWYILAALLTIGALLGLVRLLRRYKLGSWEKVFGLYCLLMVGATLAVQVAIKLWVWMYTGAQDFVAGRFMLITLLPFLILLLSGLRGLGRRNSQIWFGLWLWSTFLFIFVLSALFNHIFLQYY